jgi:hypothetical protein
MYVCMLLLDDLLAYIYFIYVSNNNKHQKFKILKMLMICKPSKRANNRGNINTCISNNKMHLIYCCMF